MSDDYAGPLPGSYWVLPGKLLAGPYPGSLNPEMMRNRLNTLLEVGITSFVDLTQVDERETYASLLPEAVQYQRFAVRDFGVPPAEQMTNILNAIDAAVEAGRVVYVHCWGGIGRTGTVIGCYLVRHGMTGAEALQEIARRLHSGSPETDEQRSMVKEWSVMDGNSESLPYGAYWAQPGKLLAGPNPGSWNDNQARQRLRRLLDLGVTFFLDLTEAGEIRGYQLLLDGESATSKREIVYRQMSIRDMDVPAQDRMAAILDMIDTAINRGHVVYVHCMAGLGRTGTVVGCYLVRHGMAGEDALDEIVRLRGGRTDSPQTDEQCFMVRTWNEVTIL